MIGAQSLEQALGVAGRFEREVELLTRWEWREGRGWRGLVMQVPYRGGELMQLEDSPDPAMLNGEFIAGLDNPGEFPSGEGVCKGKTHDRLLHMERDAHFDRGLAARMGECPMIEETDEAGALKALQIPPQLVVGDTCRVALLGKGGLTLENGAQPVIAG